MTKRNPVAKSLRSPHLRPQAIGSKKKKVASDERRDVKERMDDGDP